MWRNRAAFRPTTPENIDALFAGEGPARVPRRRRSSSSWTAGRRSAAASSSTRPRPGHTTRTSATRSCRSSTAATARWPTEITAGIAGKSSGGYGAMVTPDASPGPLRRARDARRRRALRGVLRADIRGGARALRDTTTARSSAGSRTSGRGRPSRRRRTDRSRVDGYAACYSADPDGTVRLPFDTATGELIPEIWERWLRWDPVRMARGRARGHPALDAGDLDRRGRQGRVLPGPRRRGVPSGGSRRAARRPSSSSSPRSTARSSTATRSRSGTSPSGSAPDCCPIVGRAACPRRRLAILAPVGAQPSGSSDAPPEGFLGCKNLVTTQGWSQPWSVLDGRCSRRGPTCRSSAAR